jgi:DNA-binding NtrC family response regulator
MATILILDDEPSNLEIMAAILKRQGHSILTAENAEEALFHSRTHAGGIDLVLADVVLRGRTAAEVAGDIDQYRPGVPFLFVSGYSWEALRHLFEGAGMIGNQPFLAKPFTVDRLVTEVNAVLDNTLIESAAGAV